ncbi:MAG: TFIIB-type zinc ribbon-containing protein [Planctomycetota bacterium]|jgi:Zn-finger nucleic acid-binding protein
MKCPGCGAEMQGVDDSDITTDKCTACGGVFLDKGELNALATGMAGDIEFCSKDEDTLSDKFNVRTCPKCADTPMEKVELVRYTDIIFDYCPACQGFFLDSGEVKAMNEELRAIAGKEHGQELRTHKNDRLVTVDLVSGVGSTVDAGVGGKPIATTAIRIAVYFKEPMGIGLRVHTEGWTVKLAKAFGLYRGQDLSIGNEDFDGRFVIQAEDADKAWRAFPQGAQDALLKFVAEGPQLVLQPGSLQILDDRIVYLEGPYGGELRTDVVAASPKVVDPLLAIAEMMEAG